MNRFFVALAMLLCLVALPTITHAAVFRSGERVTIPEGETVNDDIYIGSGEILIEGTVNGDVIAAGGQIRTNGTINGDLITSGGSITVNGSVTDDIRAAGGQISINGSVGDDLIVAGGDVRLEKDSSVSGTTNAYAGQLTVAGKTGGIDASVGQINVTSTATVSGDLKYMSDKEADIQSGSTVSGSITRTPTPAKPDVVDLTVKGALYSAIIGSLLAMLFLWLLPNKSANIARSMRDDLWMNVVWGFLFLIVVPILAILLMVTIIGIPLGIAVVLLYPIVIGLGKLAAAIGVGTWLEGLWKKQDIKQPTYFGAILGTLTLVLVGLIPIIGWIISCLALLIGLGALVRYDWNILTHLRENKQL